MQQADRAKDGSGPVPPPALRHGDEPGPAGLGCGRHRPRPGVAGEAGAPRRPGGPAPLRMALPEGTLPRRQPADSARAHGRHHGGRLLARRQDPGHGRGEPEHPVVGRRLVALREALGVAGQCPRVLTGWPDPRHRPRGRQDRPSLGCRRPSRTGEPPGHGGLGLFARRRLFARRDAPGHMRERHDPALGCRHASSSRYPHRTDDPRGPQRPVFARWEDPGLRGLRPHGAALGRRRAARDRQPWKGTWHGSDPWPSHRMARPWPRPAPIPPCGSGTWPPPPDRRGSCAGT